MPSFDVVSEVDEHELANAIDQANREISNRFDFKGSDARVDYAEPVLTIFADDEFKAGQVRDILEPKLVKRGIDIGCLEPGEVEERDGAPRYRCRPGQNIGKEDQVKQDEGSGCDSGRATAHHRQEAR